MHREFPLPFALAVAGTGEGGGIHSPLHFRFFRAEMTWLHAQQDLAVGSTHMPIKLPINHL